MQALTYVLVAVGLAGMWFALKHPAGWVLIAVQGILYLTYGLITKQYAFAIHGSALVLVNSRNADKALRRKRRKAQKKLRKQEKKASACSSISRAA